MRRYNPKKKLYGSIWFHHDSSSSPTENKYVETSPRLRLAIGGSGASKKDAKKITGLVNWIQVWIHLECFLNDKWRKSQKTRRHILLGFKPKNAPNSLIRRPSPGKNWDFGKCCVETTSPADMCQPQIAQKITNRHIISWHIILLLLIFIYLQHEPTAAQTWRKTSRLRCPCWGPLDECSVRTPGRRTRGIPLKIHQLNLKDPWKYLEHPRNVCNWYLRDFEGVWGLWGKIYKMIVSWYWTWSFFVARDCHNLTSRGFFFRMETEEKRWAQRTGIIIIAIIPLIILHRLLKICPMILS